MDGWWWAWQGGGVRSSLLPLIIYVTKSSLPRLTINYYSGPEGAKVKVPPLFFVIIICVFRAPNFLRGYKAQTRIEPEY